MSVSGNEVKKQAFRPLLPDVSFMDFNSIEDLDLITDKICLRYYRDYSGGCWCPDSIQGLYEGVAKTM